YRATEARIAELNKQWQDALEPKTAELARLESEIVKMVDSHGSVHAEKSKLLRGVDLEVMVTYGTYTTIDNAAVERFRLYLEKAKKVKLLHELFVKSIRWSLHPNVAAIVQAERLSVGEQALYSKCEVAKPKKPRLDIREQKRLS
ncbi:MAG TPA: hypothetical protein VKE42_08895, partial [Candidatus Cybelea sp.]|nr:hypothetical protein [Candidatus Cybelea sp.]